MLTAESLYEIIEPLGKTGYSGYTEESLGYIPFLLHAKWEQDNGKETGLDFSSTGIIRHSDLKRHNTSFY